MKGREQTRGIMLTCRDFRRVVAADASAWAGSAALGSNVGTRLKRAIPRTGDLRPAGGHGAYKSFDVGSSEAERALKLIKRSRPRTRVLCLGPDAAKAGPTGTWALRAQDFFHNGRMIGALNNPTLVVQEGGYRTRTLGVNGRHFFEGLWNGWSGQGSVAAERHAKSRRGNGAEALR